MCACVSLIELESSQQDLRARVIIRAVADPEDDVCLASSCVSGATIFWKDIMSRIYGCFIAAQCKSFCFLIPLARAYIVQFFDHE